MNRRHFVGGLAGLTVGFALGRERPLTSVRAQATGYGTSGYGSGSYGDTDTLVTPTPTPTPSITPSPVMLPIEIDRFETIRDDSGEIIGIRVCDELRDTEVCHTYE